MMGHRQGKKAVLERWRLHMKELDIVSFDTSGLMTDKNRAAVEIPLHYRHLKTGQSLAMTKANFWTFEDGWPVRLVEYYDIDRVQTFVSTLGTPLFEPN